MVIKILLAFDALKETLASAWKVIKKYWQVVIGFIAGLATILIFKGRGASKATRDLISKSKEQRDRNIAISEDKSGKVNEAVKEFIENESKAAEKHEDKISEIELESDKIKSDLLEKEEKSPGTIAEEINKIVK